MSAPGLPAPSQREALAVLWSEGTTAVPGGRDRRDGGVADGAAAAGRFGGGREAGSASADGGPAGSGVAAAGGLGAGGGGGKARSAAGRRGGAQPRDPGVAVVVLRADGRVPPGHLAAVEAGGRRGLLRDRVGLVPLRRAARVRLLSAAERAVTLPRWAGMGRGRMVHHAAVVWLGGISALLVLVFTVFNATLPFVSLIVLFLPFRFYATSATIPGSFWRRYCVYFTYCSALLFAS